MSHCHRFTAAPQTRRQMLQRCANGFGAVALTALAADPKFSNAAPTRPGAHSPFTPKKPHFTPQVKQIIYLYMDGGPSQVDTFDPKPRLEKEHGKPFAMKIETRRTPWASGVFRIAECLRRPGQSSCLNILMCWLPMTRLLIAALDISIVMVGG